MAPGSTRTNSLGKFTARRGRKRTSNVVKVKYEAPTAKNQRNQIMRNAKTLAKISKKVLSSRVFCDWQFVGQLYAKLDAGNYTTTWGAFPLMDTNSWRAVLRMDENVAEGSATFIQRLSINLRYTLGLSSWAQFNVWVVTPRKDAADRDPAGEIAAGNNPIQFIDYIEGPNAFNLRINPATYKVHFASYRTLTETTLFQGALPLAPAGNPNTTWAKGQVNVPCKTRVRAPTGGTPWKEVTYMNKPYYDRYFLLVAIVQNAPSAVQLNGGAQFAYDQLATTINDD